MYLRHTSLLPAYIPHKHEEVFDESREEQQQTKAGHNWNTFAGEYMLHLPGDRSIQIINLARCPRNLVIIVVSGCS